MTVFVSRQSVCFSLMLALFAFSGFAEGAGGKSNHAKAKAGQAAAKAVGTALLKLDPKASLIKWIGSKVTGSSHHGTLKLKSGEIEVAGGAIAAGTFDIDMTTITNEDLAESPKDMAKLVGHLNSGDFFSTTKHPTANFKITSVKPLASSKAGEPTHEIAGNLTIKGITNPIQFPAVVSMQDTGATATANFAIDRTRWDIRYNSGKFFPNIGDKIIKDDIQMDLNLVATK